MTNRVTRLSKQPTLDARKVSQQALTEIAKAEGMPSAAYIVRIHRKLIKSKGYVVFKIPVDRLLPMWFAVGLVYLENTGRWKVERFKLESSKGQEYFKLIRSNAKPS